MPAPEEGGWWDGLVASVFGKPPNSTEGLSKTPGALPGAAAEDKGKENMPAPKITVLGPVPPSQRSSTPAPSFLLGEKATARGSITDSTASGHDDEPEAPKEEPEKAKTFSMPWFNVKRPIHLQNKVVEHEQSGLSTKQKRAKARALKLAAARAGSKVLSK